MIRTWVFLHRNCRITFTLNEGHKVFVISYLKPFKDKKIATSLTETLYYDLNTQQGTGSPCFLKIHAAPLGFYERTYISSVMVLFFKAEILFSYLQLVKAGTSATI